MFIVKGTHLKFKSLTQLDSLCKGHWTVNVTRVTMRILPPAPQIFSCREFTCQMIQNGLKFTLLLVPRGFPQAVPCQWLSKGGIPRQACYWETQDSSDEWFCLMDSLAALCDFSENWLHGSLRYCYTHSPCIMLYFLGIRLVSWSWLISPRCRPSLFHRLLPFEISFSVKINPVLEAASQRTSVQFSSVAQLCLTLCNCMDCSAPGLPGHNQLPEFTQTHVHWVSDAIQPSHPLSSPSLPPSVFPRSGSFQMSQFFASCGQRIEVSASTSILPMNTLDWFTLGSPWSPRDSQESSSTP